MRLSLRDLTASPPNVTSQRDLPAPPLTFDPEPEGRRSVDDGSRGDEHQRERRRLRRDGPDHLEPGQRRREGAVAGGLRPAQREVQHVPAQHELGRDGVGEEHRALGAVEKEERALKGILHGRKSLKAGGLVVPYLHIER